MAKIRLTKKNFMEWLKSKEPTLAVGWPKTPRQCPLACYLMETKATNYVSVGATTYIMDSRTRILPEWAYQFVDRVDRFNHSPNHELYLTAEEALQIIKSI